MVRTTKYLTHVGASSRKTYAAAKSLRKAAKILRGRSSGVLGLPRTGGYTGNYVQFRSLGTGARELKFIDTNVNSVNITTGGTVNLINGVAQGTDFNQRIGRKTFIKSLLTNITIFPNATSQNGDFARLIVLYDTQCNSAAVPITTDILTAADVNAPMNLNNRDRFHIIMDKKYTFNPATYTTGNVTGGNPVTRWCNKYKKINKDTIYSGTGATTGSIQTGSIIFLALSSGGTILMNYYFRVRFYDS